MVTSDATRFANFILHPVETGRFLLDGGAMFGVVPKTLWSRHLQPDESNRIPMAMRSLLIKSETTGRIYLVDNGSGDKFSEKMQSILGLDYQHSSLPDSLDRVGVQADEITDLIFTHLHFDHCGGRSEEHTSEFQSRGHLVCRLLLEKKKYHY